MSNLDFVFDGAKKASFQLSSASEKDKNNILAQIATTITEDTKTILDANAEDIKNAREKDEHNC